MCAYRPTDRPWPSGGNLYSEQNGSFFRHCCQTVYIEYILLCFFLNAIEKEEEEEGRFYNNFSCVYDFTQRACRRLCVWICFILIIYLSFCLSLSPFFSFFISFFFFLIVVVVVVVVVTSFFLRTLINSTTILVYTVYWYVQVVMYANCIRTLSFAISMRMLWQKFVVVVFVIFYFMCVCVYVVQ